VSGYGSNRQLQPAHPAGSAAAAGRSSHRGTLEAVAEARRAEKGRPRHNNGGGKRSGWGRKKPARASGSQPPHTQPSSKQNLRTKARHILALPHRARSPTAPSAPKPDHALGRPHHRRARGFSMPSRGTPHEPSPWPAAAPPTYAQRPVGQGGAIGIARRGQVPVGCAQGRYRSNRRPKVIKYQIRRFSA